MKTLNAQLDCDWKPGEESLQVLKNILAECVEKKLIIKADINVMAMSIWGMVHGLVSLANTQRMEKFVTSNEIREMMNRGLTWLMNTMDINAQ